MLGMIVKQLLLSLLFLGLSLVYVPAHGMTPAQNDIFRAIMNDELQDITEPLAHGISLNRYYPKNYTPLMYAAYIDRIFFVRFLLEHEAAVNMQDVDGKTALHHAIVMGNVQSVKLLLDHDADTTLCNDKGETPFEIAKSRVKEGINLPECKQVLAQVATACNKMSDPEIVTLLAPTRP